MSGTLNTYPMKTSEVRKLTGWKKFYNPFVSLKKSLIKISNQIPSHEIQRAVWSATAFNREDIMYSKLIPYLIGVSFSVFIGLSCLFVMYTEWNTLWNKTFPFLLLILLSAICSVMTYFLGTLMFLVFMRYKPENKGMVLLSIHKRTTGFPELDIISSMNVFKVTDALREADFTDDDIRRIELVMSEMQAVKKFTDLRKSVVQPAVKTVLIENTEFPAPVYRPDENSLRLISRAATALGITENTDLPAGSINDKTLSMSLAYAGIGNIASVS